MSERRLLIFLCIICPFFLHFGLSLGGLSVILLWLTFTASVLWFSTVISKNTAKAAQQNVVVTVTHSAKRAKRSGNITAATGDNRAEVREPVPISSGPIKNYVLQPVISPIISPIIPLQRSPLRESEYLQRRAGYETQSGWKSKHFEPVILSKSPDHRHGNQDLYVSGGLYPSLPSYSYTEKISPNKVARTPSNVRSPLISPSKNPFINSSPQPFKPIHKMPFALDHDNSIPLPLTNRHYPTHQPQYTRTSMGLLPASSIFYGDGAGLSFSPLRKGGGVRTHSPVTVKIARPDNRRSAKPLFRRLSLEHSSGSPNPLHKDAVIAALNEKRKRINMEEPDDASSVASSAGVIAKRRRLENGSRSSTPSLAGSFNYSMINGDLQSDCSAEGSTRARRASYWSGRRGLQSHTPRNAIDSSVSSSRRASMVNIMMRKRVMIQPPMPEDSPSKKPWQPPSSPQRGEATSGNDILQSSPQDRQTAAGLTNMIQRNGEADSEMQEVTEDPNGSKDATPSKVRAKNLLTSRLKTPKLGKQGHQMLKKSGSPGEYTAADLQEDRHFAKQRVNYILGSLQEDEDKDKPQNQQEVTATSLGSKNPVISSDIVAPASVSSTEMLKLGKMKTLPVSSLPKEGLFLSSDNSGTIVSGKQTQIQSTIAGKQPSVATSAPLGVSKTSLSGGFLTSGLEKQAGTTSSSASSSAVFGVTAIDKAKSSSGITPAASSIQTTGGQSTASSAPKKDSALKGLLAGTRPALQLGGAASNTGFGLSVGKPTTTSQADHGVNPLSKPSNSGILSQGTPTSGFLMSGFLTQPQTSSITSSQGSLQPASTLSGQLQNNNITSSPFSQVIASSSVTQTTTPVGTQATSTSGFQFSASVVKPPAATSNPMSGSLFVSSAQAAPSNTQSTFQFGGTTPQVPQSSAPSTTGFQFLSTKATAASTLGSSGLSFGGMPAAAPSAQSSAAQPSAPFQFVGTTLSTSNISTPVFSLGGSAGSLAGQTMQMSSGILNTTSAAPSSLFSAANPAVATKPSFTPAFGQSMNSKPAQPSLSNFGNQGVDMGGTGGLQFKPAFGAPPQQSQQPSKPSFQFVSSPAVSATQPAAASSGGFTFTAKPAASSGSLFGAGATPSGASPFQTGAAGTTTGMFGQQSSQPPSFGSTSQPTITFGGTAPGQSVFGSQSSAAAPSTGSFNFSASKPSMADPSSGFSFGSPATQPAATQPASGGMFQFGQTTQQASQPMGSFGTPSRPTSFNFGAGGGGGFGTPAPSAAPSFGGVTPTNTGGFNLGSSVSASTQRRTSRITRQNRQRSSRR